MGAPALNPVPHTGPVRTPRLAALGAALLAALIVLSGCAGKNAVDQTAGTQYRFKTGNGAGQLIPVAQRKAAGMFSGAGLNGGTISLAQDAGQVVVVNFWATWCGPCQTETPQFDQVYRANQAKGVSFIGIDTKETSRDAAEAFVRDNKISYPIIWDENAQTAVRLGKIPALGLPFTVLIDRQQRVAAVYLRTLAPADLQPVLDQLTAES